MVKQISPFCTTAIDRLKAGPPNIPEIICKGTQWTDTSFNTTMALVWPGLTSAADVKRFDMTNYWWERWSTSYPTI
jgi:hypothetical protein